MGSIDTIRYMLELGVKVKNDQGHMEAVAVAVEAGLIPMLELLREYGWQHGDIVGNNGVAQSALNVACCKPNSAVVKYLLELGADPNVGHGGDAGRGSWGRDFLVQDRRCNLYQAAKSGCVENVDLLLRYGANRMSEACLLHGTVQSRNVEMVKRVLGLGVDVNERDNESLMGRGVSIGTPLHRAVDDTKDLEVVKILLAHGAALDRPGGYYWANMTVVEIINDDARGEQDEHGDLIPSAIKNLIKEVARSRGIDPELTNSERHSKRLIYFKLT